MVWVWNALPLILLSTWSTAGGTILESCVTFRKWGSVGRVGFWRLLKGLSSPVMYSLCHMFCCQELSYSPCLPHHDGLKSWDRISPFLPELFCQVSQSDMGVTNTENWYERNVATAMTKPDHVISGLCSWFAGGIQNIFGTVGYRSVSML